MTRAPRRVTNIFGEDAEYSKEIVDDYVHAARARKVSATVAPTEAGLEQSNPKPDKTPAEQPVVTKSDGSMVYVRPQVWPLPRQHDDLLALKAEGYSLEVMLRLARQQTQKRFKLRPHYVAATRPESYTGQAERIHVRVSKADLQSLSDQAGDLGTIPPASLIRSQVQEVWVEELDAVINKLKGKKL